MNISASEFVKQYCKKSGITEREFYAAQIPMPDQTSPSGWAAVSNNPLSIKAHVDLYSGKTTPVVPVVPEEKPIPNTLSMYAMDAVAAMAEVKGWNACRAAMLNQK